MAVTVSQGVFDQLTQIRDGELLMANNARQQVAALEADADRHDAAAADYTEVLAELEVGS